MATTLYNSVIVNQTVLTLDQIRQYRSDHAYCDMEGLQGAC